MNSEELIKKRIYSVMPVSSMHMMEFLKVLEIRFTDDVPTAAITSRVRPKLLLNKAFIEKYCKEINIIYTGTTLDKATELCLIHKPQILFLDIKLDDSSTSFTLLENCKNNKIDIFFSNS